MKRLMTICLFRARTMTLVLVLVLAVLLSTQTIVLAVTAVAPPLTISFDENGNGDVNNNGVITTLDYAMGICPVGPAWTTLYYVLPFTSVVQGDVRVLDPPGYAVTGDVLRFINVGEAAPIGRVYVFSDLPETGETPELADTGIPSLGSPYNEVYEVGPEGSNGATWTPTLSGQPGYSGTYSVTYNFTSDVPEPATICLLGLGALSLIRRKR